MRYLLVLALLAACAHAPAPKPAPVARKPSLPPPPPDDGPALRAIETQAGDLLAAQGEALWKAWTQGAQPDLDAPYEGRDTLLDPDSLALVRKLKARASGDEALALDHLAAWLTREQVGDASTEAGDAAAAAAASARVTEGGDERPFAALGAWLAAEPDRERRERIAAAASPAMRSVGAAETALRTAYDRAARSLGCESTLDLALHLRRASADSLEKLARAVLDATDAASAAHLDAVAQRVLKTPLTALHRADLPRLFADASFHPHLPRGGALAALERTLAGLDLPLRAPGVTVLEAPTPGKDPRAACIPVRIPADVRFSVLPATGDWAPLYREAACALRLSRVKEHPLEFGMLGPGVAGETFAALFEQLTSDPGWLRDQGALTDAEIESWQKAAVTLDLYRARWSAARVLTELAGGGEDAWRTWQERALGFAPGDPAEAAVDGDPFLADADRLRGLVLAAQLRAHLVKLYGTAWWHERAAGAELAKLMARGSALDAAELARAAGYTDLDAAPLAAALR